LKRFKTGDYRSALRTKGFKSERHTGDEIFYLYVGEVKTQIFTKVSHGSSEDIGNPLLRMIKIQLCLDNKEIERFIGCPMEYPEYIETLRSKGFNL
jgi:hypothetical protein